MVTDVNWTYCGDHYAMCSCVCSVTQSRPTLCAPMDCVAHQAPLSVHGIFQARMLEWVAISFSPSPLNRPFKTQQFHGGLET